MVGSLAIVTNGLLLDVWKVPLRCIGGKCFNWCSFDIFSLRGVCGLNFVEFLRVNDCKRFDLLPLFVSVFITSENAKGRGGRGNMSPFVLSSDGELRGMLMSGRMYRRCFSRRAFSSFFVFSFLNSFSSP